MARSQFFIFIMSLIFSSMSCYALKTPNANLDLNIAKIQNLTGQTGQLDQDKKIYKITIPRDDLKILMSGMQMNSDMGLSSWIAFKKTDNQTSVNGDLILLQDQINPVMSVALTNGLEVTGLHNPYLWDSPRVMFMHIKGEGDELQLANAIGQVLKKIKATSNGGGDFPLGNLDFLRTTLDAHKIDVILGQKGQFKDDVYKIEFSDGVKATDTEVNKAMALNTWAAFAGSDSEAVVNGTIVLHESELQKALVKLRNAQIYVLAIYQNMINDNRDLVLINFWGIGNTQTLAKTLRSVFFIAQNNNPTNIIVGGIVPDISTINAETEIGMIPVQLSLYKNDNCGYAKAKELYTSIDTIQNINVDYAKQLGATLRIALNLTQKIVSEKMTKFVSFLPATSQMIQSTEKKTQVLPSAKNLLLKLSVVSNNIPEFIKLVASASVIASVESDEEIAISDSMQVPSAVLYTTQNTTNKKLDSFVTALSEKLPMLKNNVGVLISQPLISLLTHLANGTKSLANAIPVILSNEGVRFYTYITKLKTSYIESAKSHINSISASLSAAVKYIYAQMNEFVTSYANIFRSLAHTISTAVVRDISEFSALYVSVSQLFDYATFAAVANVSKSVSNTISARVAHVHENINKFSVLSANISQSFAHVLSTMVGHVHTNINEFAMLSVSVSKSLSHATFFILSETASFTHSYVNGFIISFKQTFDLLKNTMIQLAQSSANQSVMLLAEMTKPAPNAVNSMAQNKMKPLLQSLPMPASADAESISQGRLTLFSSPVTLATIDTPAAKSISSDPLATAPAVVAKNTTKDMSQPSSKLLVAAVETKSKIPSVLKPLTKILSPVLLSPLALPPPASTVQVAQKKEVDAVKLVKNKLANISQVTPKAEPSTLPVKEARVSQPEKIAVKAQPVSVIVVENKVIEVAKVPEKIMPLAFPLAGSKTTEVTKPTKKILAASLPVAPVQSHDQITKSLSAVLPVTQHKIITASSRKTLPASLPMPQHKIIRVATLSTLSSVIPVTHHKVKALSVIQPKTMKVAKLSTQPLPHVQSIKNHNVPPRVKSIVKPSASFAHAKIIKHREQLNKELSVTLHTAHNKHARYVPSRVVIYPAAHDINRQPVEKITEKPREIAHTISHKEDWNTEQLAPEPQPPVRVAQQHAYREQAEFDDGPAVLGAYPYDEEPTSGGFGG